MGALLQDRQTGWLTVGRNIRLRHSDSETGFTRVEAGSNTSTVTLRVVGGDKKGSLKCETVKYGLKSQGLEPEKHCAGKGQQHIQKTDPTSRQRGRPTRTRPQLSHK
jgi:hypothetical protein